MYNTHLRTCIFRPYRGPGTTRFVLTMFATDRCDSRGQTLISYELASGNTVLFAGDDFSGSPMHADDSDATVAALMGFLTLRPGDTDDSYFDAYTTVQLAYVAAHAEALANCCTGRFSVEARS